MLLCLSTGVLWLWHFLYRIGPHPVSDLHIFTYVVSRAFMAGAASQAGDADSSRAPGLTSGLQGSVNVHRGDLLLLPHWQCISFFLYFTLGFKIKNMQMLFQMSELADKTYELSCVKLKISDKTAVTIKSTIQNWAPSNWENLRLYLVELASM